MAVLVSSQDLAEKKDKAEPLKDLMPFSYPCGNYLDGLRGKGNFGLYINKSKSKSVFGGTYHLAEDIRLPGRTEVRCVADGVVMYSDFSPTWTDKNGGIHWNLGNVIVIQHKLVPPEDGLEYVCSFYVHLAKDRKVKAGDKVERGELIGYIGKNKSEENGNYPAHLHFGIHRGPYHQISPSWKRKLVEDAKKIGLPFGEKRKIIKGEIEVKRNSRTSVLIKFKNSNESGILSLLVGSTSPGYKPADIMGWCEGYGDRDEVKEWIRPSTWIKSHLP